MSENQAVFKHWAKYLASNQNKLLIRSLSHFNQSVNRVARRPWLSGILSCLSSVCRCLTNTKHMHKHVCVSRLISRCLQNQAPLHSWVLGRSSRPVQRLLIVFKPSIFAQGNGGYIEFLISSYKSIENTSHSKGTIKRAFESRLGLYMHAKNFFLTSFSTPYIMKLTPLSHSYQSLYGKGRP